MIAEEILVHYKAKLVDYKKGDIIFNEGDPPKYYYQVKEGELKVNNYTEEGKEYIHEIISNGRSFGEATLFTNYPYPANAITLTDCSLYKLAAADFFKLLEDLPEVHSDVSKAMAKRIYFKAIMSAELSFQKPEHRILRFIDYLKNRVYKKEGEFQFEVDLTRQQIADLTGLRVETVIRAIKHLEQEGELKIYKRKVFR